jgi:hypothetical protein
VLSTKIRGNGFKVAFSSDTVEDAVPNTEKDYRVKGLNNNFMCVVGSYVECMPIPAHQKKTKLPPHVEVLLFYTK